MLTDLQLYLVIWAFVIPLFLIGVALFIIMWKYSMRDPHANSYNDWWFGRVFKLGKANYENQPL